MNCEEFRKIVHEVAREEARGDRKTLSAAEAVSARFHAETCAACGARLKEAQAVASALQIAAEDSAKAQARPYVEMAVLDAFREHQRTQERMQHRQRRLPMRWTEWIAVSAAAAVLMTIGGWKFSQRHSANVNSATAAAQAATVNPVATNVNSPAALASDSQDTAAQDSDFVPLPYGEDFSADDPGVVVRVSMTREALGSLGYPVNEMRGQDLVQADLVVGEDGWPRAVRLVQ
ncbi:MAG TPA: hypothetical protein VFU57_12530 [Candidatus Acidoferrales bacterium]|nr:hypothetical protein [Candidatus Acidoferrales bacterium]